MDILLEKKLSILNQEAENLKKKKYKDSSEKTTNTSLSLEKFTTTCYETFKDKSISM